MLRPGADVLLNVSVDQNRLRMQSAWSATVVVAFIDPLGIK